MKIKLHGRYKSLLPFESEELSTFCIITGLNGSGKSQLHELFKELSENSNQGKRLLDTNPKFPKIHTTPLITESIWGASPSNYVSQLKNLHAHYNEELLHVDRRILWKAIHEKSITSQQLLQATKNEDTASQEFNNIFGQESDIISDETVTRIIFEIFKTPPNLLGNKLAVIRYLSNNYKWFTRCVHVATSLGKDLFNLTESDFLNAVVPEDFTDVNDLTGSRIENIFYAYLRNRYKNSINNYRKEKYGEQNNSVSDSEFAKQHPSPWLIINNFLSSNDLDYYFKEIPEADYSIEADVRFHFIRKSNDELVPFEGLSSGEKVIIGLMLRLFTTKFYENNLSFPGLIFLDEPDAHLHPRMSKLLIDVLSKTFVQQLGIQVIITTHSPATVAVAPSDSIFELKNIPVTELKRIDKDYALSLLTTGLPNLSINYESHRQIFVESPTDRYYYQTIFDKLRTVYTYPHNLYFICNGYGEGNRDQVIQIVQSLRNAGNKTASGIIDWDKTEKSVESVHIHGKDQRYSMENFLLDPQYLTILLLELNYGDLKTEIGYSDSDNQYKLDIKKIQKASSFLSEKLAPKFKPQSKDKTIVECTYGGGEKLNIPKWYLEINGHDLKEKLLQAFPPLQSLKKNYDLEKRLTEIVGKKFPVIPIETEMLLFKLAN